MKAAHTHVHNLGYLVYGGAHATPRHMRKEQRALTH